MKIARATLHQIASQLRKDFLTIVANIPRVDTLQKYKTLHEGVKQWDKHLESLHRTIQSELKRSPDSSQYYLTHQKPFWDFVGDFHGFPKIGTIEKAESAKELKDRMLSYGNMGSEQDLDMYILRNPPKTQDQLDQEALKEWQLNAKSWEAKVRRKAMAAWEWVSDVVTWVERNGRAMQNLPQPENQSIMGFQVQVRNYEGSETQVRLMNNLQAGLHDYREKASKVYPWLLANQLPIVADFDVEGSEEYAGSYEQDHIILSLWGLNDLKDMAHVIAHEMGHHIYKKVLNDKQREFWGSAIRGDLAPLDLRDVLSQIRPNERVYQFEERVKVSDPVLYLQIYTLMHNPSYMYLGTLGMSGLKELIDKGTTHVLVPKNPITGYAGKNSEEAFCETLGMLVGYGPMTVLSEVKKWFWYLQPGVKMASMNRQAMIQRVANSLEVPYHFSPVIVQEPKRKRNPYPYQGYIEFQGFEIDVENVKGSIRSGTDPNGKKWSTKMHNHYGELRGTTGSDGDPLDVYVGPNLDSPLAVIVHQYDPQTGKYDEDKTMLGFDNVDEAIGAFKKQYDQPGYYREGEYTALPIGSLGRWIADKSLHGKRFKIAKRVADMFS